MSRQSFLSLVASDLLEKYGKNLHQITIVFPNKRAGLFLNQELARLSPEPVWAPRYATMSDIFMKLTDLARAESIEAVCTLYRIYCEELGEEATETLDQFYGWGEMLLADFDDIDKHLADAKGLFANIHDLQELSDLSYLTPEQEEALRNFFQHFNMQRSTVLQDKFLLLWKHMFRLYSRLKDELQKRGCLYEGALFRSVVERFEDYGQQQEMLAKLPQNIVFAGFNVLNDVEEQLMLMLKKEQRARFYWDYDIYYTQAENNEAGLFMRHNLKVLGNALSEELFDNISKIKDITYVSTSFDNAQARYATTWLQGELDPVSRNNAIVLCDETQLLPLLHSIPHEGEPGHPKAMNATMGFPLRDTPVFSFLTALISLQTEGYDRDRKQFRHSFLRTVYKHPYYHMTDQGYAEQYTGGDSETLLNYLAMLIRQVGKHFAKIEKPDLYEQLYIEALFQTHRLLQQLLQLIRQEDVPLKMEQTTLRRLLRNLMNGINIPFHGEPAVGIQIMGVLETRCLDFNHMLILNLEEGKLPKSIHESSLIPASLREAFGLTTIRHKIAVYAYYFYRLIQRAEHITCVYNEHCSGNAHHEMSRFLRQLQAETNLPIRNYRMTTEPRISDIKELAVEKDAEIMDKLLSKYAIGYRSGIAKEVQTLSPSAINCYLDCPLRFYYQYVAQLRTVDNPDEPNMQPILGTILHDTAELVYNQIMERYNTREIRHEYLNPFVANFKQNTAPLLDIMFDVHLIHPVGKEKEREKRIQTLLLPGNKPNNTYLGEHIIYYNVILTYLTQLFRYDLLHTPFTMVGMETDRSIMLHIDNPAGSLTIRVGGRIDRIDIMDGKLRIVDYKSGRSNSQEVKSLDQVFIPSKNRNGYYLQIMLYALAQLLHENPEYPVMPALFFVGKAADDKEYDPSLKLGNMAIEDFTDYAEEFLERLKTVLSEIFNPQVPFTQTCHPDTCKNCPYYMLCH